MRKILAFALVIAALLGVSGCQPRGEVFKAELVSDRYVLSWNDNVYHGYGFIDDNSNLIGEKFATVDSGGKNAMSIYLVNGYEPEQWVIFSESTLMGSHVLYKEDDVADTPAEFEGLSFDK